MGTCDQRKLAWLSPSQLMPRPPHSYLRRSSALPTQSSCRWKANRPMSRSYKSIPLRTPSVAGAWKQPYQPICKTKSRIAMNTSTRRNCFITRLVRVAAVAAAGAWMALHCGTASAQASQPSPKSAAEQQKKAQEGRADAQVLEQLAHQIEALKTELQKTQERIA